MAHVLQGHVEEHANVLVVQGVVDVSPLLAVAHEPLTAKQAKVMRARRLGEAGDIGQVAHAELVSLEQCGDQPQAPGVGQQPERLGELQGSSFGYGRPKPVQPLVGHSVGAA